MKFKAHNALIDKQLEHCQYIKTKNISLLFHKESFLLLIKCFRIKKLKNN